MMDHNKGLDLVEKILLVPLPFNPKSLDLLSGSRKTPGN